MKILLLATVLMTGCSLPTAPSPQIEGGTTFPILTSRVNPDDVELAGLTLEHDPRDPNVSLCRTKSREYCSADGASCGWEIDYYTVMRPNVCPINPID